MSSPDVPMGDRFIARLIGNSGTETGTAVREIISDLSGTGTSSTKSVLVVTGEEVRPNATTVFWIGGSVQPTNMGPDDLWFSPSATGPATDTTPPSAPTGLVSSDITADGFSLTWTASTDNSAVTGYDIYLNGILKASTSVNSAAITGLAADTSYSVTIEARDAANNISVVSEALSVTTGSATGAPVRHSIWGASPYPYAVVKETGTPITVANSFYSYGTSPDVSAWRVIGMKIWIPAGVTLTGPIDCKAWAFLGHGLQINQTAPVTGGTITAPVSGQWNEVIFDTPIQTNSGDVVWCGYRASNAEYLGFNSADGGYVTALDGSHIVLSEVAGAQRGQWLEDGGAWNWSTAVYSIDVIYDEGLA